MFVNKFDGDPWGLDGYVSVPVTGGGTPVLSVTDCRGVAAGDTSERSREEEGRQC